MVSQTSTMAVIISLLSILSVVNGHMIMKTPIPYGRGSINNSPLANDGSDFPCKNIFDMTDPVNDVNHLVPGVPSTLSFTGSAVHGGGSCQVSLTKDLKPTKGSKWMVIKSIEGGCPADVSGNLPADPSGNGASTFQYTVPAGFPEGQYTIAWTWFNKIGNREMYMNCGRASIANSKKRYAPAPPKIIEDRQTSYPDLFTANLDIFQCKVPDSMNVVFPNPGADLQTVGNANDKSTFTAPTGCGASSGNTSPDTGSGSSPASPASSAASGGAPSVSTAPSSASTGTTGSPQGGNPGIFASGAASQTASASSAVATSAATASVAPIPGSGDSPSTGSPATSSPSTASPAISSPSTNSPSTGSPSTSSPSTGSPSTGSTSTGSTSQGTACTSEGAYACAADGSSFQRCASGLWSASIQMAAGTQCTPGQSSLFTEKVVVVGTKSGKRGLAEDLKSSILEKVAVLFSA